MIQWCFGSLQGKNSHGEHYINASEEKKIAQNLTRKISTRVLGRYPIIDSRHISLSAGIELFDRKWLHILCQGKKRSMGTYPERYLSIQVQVPKSQCIRHWFHCNTRNLAGNENYFQCKLRSANGSDTCGYKRTLTPVELFQDSKGLWFAQTLIRVNEGFCWVRFLTYHNFIIKILLQTKTPRSWPSNFLSLSIKHFLYKQNREKTPKKKSSISRRRSEKMASTCFYQKWIKLGVFIENLRKSFPRRRMIWVSIIRQNTKSNWNLTRNFSSAPLLHEFW